MTITVFHNDKIYAEFEWIDDYHAAVADMPKDVIVYDPEECLDFRWSNRHWAVIKDSDVPPMLKHLQLVLSL